MKKAVWLFIVVFIVCSHVAVGQSIHFSQYYNAPLLLNAANTALLPGDDYQVGANYRTQWSSVPVPYKTFAAFADCKVGGNRENVNHNNWLGLGLVFFDDKAGDGNLSLLQVQGDLAYHLRLSEFTMISLGLSGATIQRSVNYDNLIFDQQWDGVEFNPHLANGEKVGIIKTSYYTIGAGGNVTIFPNENLYIKLGGGATNINTPTESFYKSSNVVGLRPTGNLDVIFKTGPSLLINPSVYYTTQTGASELVAGAQFRIKLSSDNSSPTELILGAYDRLADAIIGVVGVKISGVQFTASYDMTTSALAPYNSAYGALEFSIIYQSPYGRNKDRISKQFSCPRFF